MREEVNSKKPPPRKGGADLSIKIKIKIKENEDLKSLSNSSYIDFLKKGR